MHSDADGTRKVDLDALGLSLIQLLSSNSHPNSDLATSGLSLLVEYTQRSLSDDIHMDVSSRNNVMNANACNYDCALQVCAEPVCKRASKVLRSVAARLLPVSESQCEVALTISFFSRHMHKWANICIVVPARQTTLNNSRTHMNCYVLYVC